MREIPRQQTTLAYIIRVALKIMQDTTYTLINNETGEEYSTSDDLAPNKAISLKSGYEDWKYWNGVSHIAFMRLAELTNDERYKDYVLDNYHFSFQHMAYFKQLYPFFEYEEYMPNYHQFLRMDRLDDCGAMDAALIEAYELDNNKDWLERLQFTANYISKEQDRLSSGLFCRRFKDFTTIWADDAYMSIPFLARYGKFTEETKYYDDALLQSRLFHQTLFNSEKGIYAHSRCIEMNTNGVAHWGRANGWAMVAKCDLLEALPTDYEGRDEVITSLFDQIIGISRYQSKNGMWHQLLDKQDSFLETSCTAMFTYSIAKAINEGWIPDIYSAIALKGWEGITENIDEEGLVHNISEGFNIRQDLPYYYERTCPVNDPHGLGAVILAGIEISKMKDYQHCIWE